MDVLESYEDRDQYDAPLFRSAVQGVVYLIGLWKLRHDQSFLILLVIGPSFHGKGFTWKGESSVMNQIPYV